MSANTNVKLTSLVDVVVLVLVHVGTQVGSRTLDLTDLGGVGVGSSLLVELLLVLGKHVLLVLADDCRGGRLDVLGLEHLLVLDGLNSVLVVVDMSLTVDSLDGLYMLLRADLLLDDLGSHFRAYLVVSKVPSEFREELTSVESGLCEVLRKFLTPVHIRKVRYRSE